MKPEELLRLSTPPTQEEIARLIEAIPSRGESEELHWIARRMAFELDRRFRDLEALERRVARLEAKAVEDEQLRKYLRTERTT